jgi:GNAT superfamily N-acetyltransferase
MCEEWMQGLQLQLTSEQFQQLPRNGAFRYDRIGEKVYISPRPKHYHALLPLRLIETAQVSPVSLRIVQPGDWTELAPVFAAAFSRIQPFAGLDLSRRYEAAVRCLERTRTGGDGPWLERASIVANQGEDIVGAILITLLPDGDPCSWDSYGWQSPPPPDCIERRLGRPHLTWVFVSPDSTGHGIGSAMLSAAVRELLAQGYTELASTFMIGNDVSVLWHWRNGFRLLRHPGSFLRGARSGG